MSVCFIVGSKPMSISSVIGAFYIQGLLSALYILLCCCDGLQIFLEHRMKTENKWISTFKTSWGSDQLYLACDQVKVAVFICVNNVCVCAHLQVCGTDAHLQARAGVTHKVRLSLLYSPIPDVTNLCISVPTALWDFLSLFFISLLMIVPLTHYIKQALQSKA